MMDEAINIAKYEYVTKSNTKENDEFDEIFAIPIQQSPGPKENKKGNWYHNARESPKLLKKINYNMNKKLKNSFSPFYLSSE